MGTEGIVLNLGIYEKCTVNLLLKYERLKAFPPKTSNKKVMSTLVTSIE